MRILHNNWDKQLFQNEKDKKMQFTSFIYFAAYLLNLDTGKLQGK